ncbi:MAG TPA: preprotein translocase subunit SecG [Terriglobales bacterium]|jgi:preprotein translocase subunit SecG
MLITLITIVHIIVCLFLIIVVLLQSGKGGDIAAAFAGGMGSQTAFGPRGAATALSKATTWSAVIFMVTSIVLSIFAQRRTTGSNSVLQGVKPTQTQSQPASPSQQPATPQPQK